jgi:Leucine-rich repeat (LRR) protein
MFASSQSAAALLDTLATASQAKRLTIHASQLQPLLAALESQQQEGAAPAAGGVRWPQLTCLRVAGLEGVQQMAALEALLDALPALHHVQQIVLVEKPYKREQPHGGKVTNPDAVDSVRHIHLGAWRLQPAAAGTSVLAASAGSTSAAAATAATTAAPGGAGGGGNAAAAQLGGGCWSSSCTSMYAHSLGREKGHAQHSLPLLMPLLAPLKGLRALSLRDIDLQQQEGQEASTLPPNLTGITALRLRQCAGSAAWAEAALECLPDLAALELSWADEDMESLPSSVVGCSNLQCLDLQYNSLTTLPSSISSLQRLSLLQLEENGITAFPPGFGQLGALRSLNASENKLVDVTEVGGLGNLEQLDLSGNAIEELPGSMRTLVHAADVCLDSNLLEKLPAGFGGMTSISRLSIKGNRLQRLPDSFTELVALQQLCLEGNQLVVLPEGWGALCGLTRLEVAGNRLERLPTSFGNLGRLKWLDLSSNRLLHLHPDSMGGLTSLVSLGVGHNSLFTLPHSISRLEQLQHLHARGNLMPFLPAGICRLPGLLALNVRDNHLTCLPDSIGAVTGLVALDLSHNHISHLPDGVTKLLSLRGLSLVGNQLEQLPRGLGALCMLRHLRMHDNHLVALPDSITRLSGVQVLTYDAEAIFHLPPGLTALYPCHPGTAVPNDPAVRTPPRAMHDFPLWPCGDLGNSSEGAPALAAAAAAAAQLEQHLAQEGYEMAVGSLASWSPLHALLQQVAAAPEVDGAESDGAEWDEFEADGSESDGAEADGVESDGAESDESESDGAESDEPESDGAESDEPESDGAESDESEADESESDGAESDEPEADGANAYQRHAGIMALAAHLGVSDSCFTAPGCLDCTTCVCAQEVHMRQWRCKLPPCSTLLHFVSSSTWCCQQW